jgi:hypothetical protein
MKRLYSGFLFLAMLVLASNCNARPMVHLGAGHTHHYIPAGVENLLTGRWAGMDWGAAIEPLPVVLIFREDGTYVQTTTFEHGFKLKVWGNYRLTMASATAGTITMIPGGWAPTKACSRPQKGRKPSCFKIKVPALRLPITIGQTEIEIGHTELSRQDVPS